MRQEHARSGVFVSLKRVARVAGCPAAVRGAVIIAGIRLAIGRGLIGMIIAEFYTTISGLGFMITRYANVFEMDKTFVPVIVLMVLGVSLTSLLKWVGRRIAPWSSANR